LIFKFHSLKFGTIYKIEGRGRVTRHEADRVTQKLFLVDRSRALHSALANQDTSAGKTEICSAREVQARIPSASRWLILLKAESELLGRAIRTDDQAGAPRRFRSHYQANRFLFETTRPGPVRIDLEVHISF
jgi:hypothetical protein